MKFLLNIKRRHFKINSLYNSCRFKIFCTMFLCYILFYFSRKSLIFMAPLMIENLKISIYDVGIINSIFYIMYAFSKFICGVISDKSHSKYLMFIGLFLTGLFNVCVGFSNNIILIAIFWTLNAFFQGWGWPPITRHLTYWYVKSERGVWWGILSISHNIGGAIIPIIVGFLSLLFSWRMNFFIIGLFCMCISLFLIDILKNTPNHPKILLSVGMIKIFDFKIITLVRNKNIYLLCLCYFFIYLVRTAINDWLVLYMINQKEHTLFLASMCIFYFEVGGILGILVAGWMTDRIIKNRLIFLFFSVICLFFMSVIFYNIPVGFNNIEYFVIFFLGFFLFAPQMLIGLIASEFVSKNKACTANSLVGSFAYMGASLAGYPFSLIINISWNVYFIMIIFCEIVLVIILIIFFLNSK